MIMWEAVRNRLGTAVGLGWEGRARAGRREAAGRAAEVTGGHLYRRLLAVALPRAADCVPRSVYHRLWASRG